MAKPNSDSHSKDDSLHGAVGKADSASNSKKKAEPTPQGGSFREILDQLKQYAVSHMRESERDPHGIERFYIQGLEVLKQLESGGKIEETVQFKEFKESLRELLKDAIQKKDQPFIQLLEKLDSFNLQAEPIATDTPTEHNEEVVDTPANSDADTETEDAPVKKKAKAPIKRKPKTTVKRKKEAPANNDTDTKAADESGGASVSARLEQIYERRKYEPAIQELYALDMELAGIIENPESKTSAVTVAFERFEKDIRRAIETLKNEGKIDWMETVDELEDLLHFLHKL